MNEIDNLIQKNPNQSIKILYDDKEIELVNKFGAELVAKYWPEFDTQENGLFVKKNKCVPKLPTSLEDLQDLPEEYKLTTTKKPFLASPVDMFSKYMLMISLIGHNILAESLKWWCDGTFKTSPRFYFQHYIIHGKYKDAWPLPGVFAFLSGKSYDIYNFFLTQFKIKAAEYERRDVDFYKL